MERPRGDRRLAVLIALLALGCSESSVQESRIAPPTEANARVTPPSEDSQASAGGPADSEAVARGRVVYAVNCSICHNPDPKLPGTLGPEVAGSSVELLEARLLRNSYPEGYTPKRDSRVMMALPHLKDDIGPLAAYLADPGST